MHFNNDNSWLNIGILQYTIHDNHEYFFKKKIFFFENTDTFNSLYTSLQLYIMVLNNRLIS